LKLVLSELNKELNRLESRSKRQLFHYRDLLIIGFLAVLPLRLGNVHCLDLDRTIVKNGNCYEVHLEGHETKNSAPYFAPLPHQLTFFIEAYLTIIRPRFLGTKSSPAMWLSFRGDRLAGQTIYQHLIELTGKLLGTELTPHIFRDIAATYLSTHHPETVRSAAAVLGHKSFQTTQKHYNQARMLAAIRRFQAGI
jgi:integrase/recombinase XerD